MNINTIHNNTIFDFMFGTVPPEQLSDVQQAIYLLFLLGFADILTRLLAEDIKYNRFVGKKLTFINVLTGLWNCLWAVPVLRRGGRKKLVRFFFSTKLTKGLFYKMGLYAFLLAGSLWVTKMPHTPLFGIHLDISISVVFMVAPVFIELYSIGENFVEIDSSLFKKVFRFIVLIRRAIKGS